MSRWFSWLRSERGSTAAEFALVLPAALLLIFGVFDGGRYMWSMNRLEKAVQMGTRTAVVTGIVPVGLNSYDFTGKGLTCPVPDGSGGTVNKTIQAGDTICASALGTITCTMASAGSDASCTCVPTTQGANSCPTTGTPDATATNRFNRILSRMRVVDPSLQPGEVTITYSGSGLGYAGDPAVDDSGAALSDAAPIVTVSVNRASVRAMLLLGGRIPLPGFHYSQTMEDGDGQVSY
ncbi:TadE/TadG family type IV pilus assembly protein [Tsuneonella mangrovi]|uniref:TadE/TadG family type IV pilus assembly protein n=1 Tax=Tsuneonella mangrovi TaxID=1982042 RepID=UPI000BA2134E|nr:TadE/TadG family type IV pilus assembly protein [Tsuneonella mangrovi]